MFIPDISGGIYIRILYYKISNRDIDKHTNKLSQSQHGHSSSDDDEFSDIQI